MVNEKLLIFWKIIIRGCFLPKNSMVRSYIFSNIGIVPNDFFHIIVVMLFTTKFDRYSFTYVCIYQNESYHRFVQRAYVKLYGLFRESIDNSVLTLLQLFSLICFCCLHLLQACCVDIQFAILLRNLIIMLQLMHSAKKRQKRG